MIGSEGSDRPDFNLNPGPKAEGSCHAFPSPVFASKVSAATKNLQRIHPNLLQFPAAWQSSWLSPWFSVLSRREAIPIGNG